jgi:hypothetical protein
MIAYAFGGMLFGVPEAIESAGLGDQAVAVSQAGGPLNFGFIAAGQHQVAEVGMASELIGWRAIDAAARILAGDGPRFAPTHARAGRGRRHARHLSGTACRCRSSRRLDRRPDRAVARRPGFQDQFTALWGG